MHQHDEREEMGMPHGNSGTFVVTVYCAICGCVIRTYLDSII